jgi:hypothetical protein
MNDACDRGFTNRSMRPDRSCPNCRKSSSGPFIQRQIRNQQDRNLRKGLVNLDGSFRSRCPAAERRFHNHQIDGSTGALQQLDCFFGAAGPNNDKTTAVQDRVHGMGAVELTIEDNGCFHRPRGFKDGPAGLGRRGGDGSGPASFARPRRRGRGERLLLPWSPARELAWVLRPLAAGRNR